MKTLIAAATVALAFSFAADATAQSPAGANAKKYGIAVVDISYIFKNHAGFLAKMEGMKGEVQGIEKQLEAERQKIVGMEEQKTRFKPGTPEFSQLDDKIATSKASFQLNMQRMRKGFLEKEAKVYYETYQEVNQMIENYAKYQGLGLVLRFNGEPADPAQREAVLRDINKPVQYQNSIDITPDVLALLNRNNANATRPGAPRPQ
ncbi:MAG: OmpH family outer membrane protein [Planctomycetota bacterium]